MKILENCINVYIYFHCNYTKLFPYYFEMNVHLLSSQTSFVHPRLLRRVDFSEATVLAVYLDQDGVQYLVKILSNISWGHLLKKTFLEEISPHFSFEKITESSDRFFSNYSLLGLTLNFFPISTLVQFSNSISLLCWLDDMPQGFGNEIKTEFHSQL